MNTASAQTPSAAAAEEAASLPAIRRVIELRKRDGCTVVGVAEVEVAAGSLLPDVILFEDTLYHQVAQGRRIIFVESVFYALKRPESV